MWKRFISDIVSFWWSDITVLLDHGQNSIYRTVESSEQLHKEKVKASDGWRVIMPGPETAAIQRKIALMGYPCVGKRVWTPYSVPFSVPDEFLNFIYRALII